MYRGSLESEEFLVPGSIFPIPLIEFVEEFEIVDQPTKSDSGHYGEVNFYRRADGTRPNITAAVKTPKVSG
jgi:hypothetical protein